MKDWINVGEDIEDPLAANTKAKGIENKKIYHRLQLASQANSIMAKSQHYSVPFNITAKHENCRSVCQEFWRLTKWKISSLWPSHLLPTFLLLAWEWGQFSSDDESSPLRVEQPFILPLTIPSCKNLQNYKEVLGHLLIKRTKERGSGHKYKRRLRLRFSK